MNKSFSLPVDKNKFKQNLNLILDYMLTDVESIVFTSVGTMNNITRSFSTYICMDEIYKNKTLLTRNIIDTIEEHWKINNVLEVKITTVYRQQFVHQVTLSDFIKNNYRLENTNNCFKLSAKLVDVLIGLLPLDFLPYNVTHKLPLDSDLASDHIVEFKFATMPDEGSNNQIMKVYAPDPNNKTLGKYTSEIVMYLLGELKFGRTRYTVNVQYNYPHPLNGVTLNIDDRNKLKDVLFKGKSIFQALTLMHEENQGII